MLKFEFVVTGMELTDAQKERISAAFPALVTRSIEPDRPVDASRFWCLCKVDGRTVAHERMTCPEGGGSDEAVAGFSGKDAADAPAVLVFDLV